VSQSPAPIIRFLTSSTGEDYAAIWRLPRGLSLSLEKVGRLRVAAIFEASTRRTLIEVQTEGVNIRENLVEALAEVPVRMNAIEVAGLAWEESGEGPDPRVVHRDWLVLADRLLVADVGCAIPGPEAFAAADRQVQPVPSVDEFKQAI
jgi:hypothetical protein